MGQDKNEWYKWTWPLLLGENGFLYSRHHKYTEMNCTAYTNTDDNWSAASRLINASDFVKFDESKIEGANSMYHYPFGSFVREALLKAKL